MRSARGQIVTSVATEPLGSAVGIAVFAIVALLGNAAGTAFRYPDLGAAIFFPPYAALVTALTLSPRRHWAWYILVGAVAHFTTSWPRWSLSWVLLADVANISRALVAAVLLRALFRGPPRLSSAADLARFVVAGVLVAPAIGATLGAANVVLQTPSSAYWSAWQAWYMSNALTGLTMLPTFVLAVESFVTRRRALDSAPRVAESAALIIALAATSAVAFFAHTDNQWQLALLFYAPLPVLIWTALRFGAASACAAVTAVSIAAMVSADRNAGPFAGSSPDHSVFIVQVFVLLTTLPVLGIVAISGARQRVVQLHRALLASLDDHVAILDAHGVVLETNESWRTFADEGRALFHTARVGDDFVQACRNENADGAERRVADGVVSVLAGERERFDLEYDFHDGPRGGRYALSVEPLERPDGGAVVIRADVTARRDAEVEIEEQRRQLSHLARVAALGQLSGALAHELNQPLASIASNAEAARLLVRRKSFDRDELDAILHDIVVDDQRAARVIRRLRALLKRGETRINPVAPSELVGEVLDLARAELLAQGVTMTVAVPQDLPMVLADRVQLQQVLLNLILNAAEAMTTTPINSRKAWLAATTETGGAVRFSIRDAGTGIPSQLIDHVFEPFVTTKAQGLGLGLSISRAIVAAHGGRLWAENNPDHGVSVHCVVPTAAVV
jgi:signal transduction histidine kinase